MGYLDDVNTWIKENTQATGKLAYYSEHSGPAPLLVSKFFNRNIDHQNSFFKPFNSANDVGHACRSFLLDPFHLALFVLMEFLNITSHVIHILTSVVTADFANTMFYISSMKPHIVDVSYSVIALVLNPLLNLISVAGSTILTILENSKKQDENPDPECALTY